MFKVLVLLSTYNGSKFLIEQLDSLFTQKSCEFKLLVRDDGSSDSTLDILYKYQQLYPKSIDILKGKNIGWKKSFFELLKIAYIRYKEFEYFAFCDQDDVWLPEKLFVGIQKLNLLPQGCNLYCSNLFYYKDGVNYGLIRKEKVLPTFKSCLVRNYATGCTVIFNRELLFLVSRKLPVISIAHDYWLYQIAVLCGHVFIDEQSYILYRQHENNQIGNRSSWIDIWKRRLKDFRYYNLGHHREEGAKELLRLFAKDMHPLAIEATRKMSNYRRSFCSQLSLLLDGGYTLGKKANDRWLKLRIILRHL